jgi:tellurite resistance protein TerC
VDVPVWGWWLTLGLTAAVLVVDVFVIGRRPHEPSRRELVAALSTYLGAAVLFGIGVWVLAGPRYGTEFFAGWLTEYSLSVDNLFIFLIIMSRFGVPRQYQQKALLIGIVLALVFRAVFIAVGAAAINQFSWVFYVFGAFLVYTGFKLAVEGPEAEEEYTENRLVRWARSVLPHTEEGDWGGGRVWLRRSGVLLFTPMFAVIVALGTTDLLFALDSIPAIFGLTKEPYLVLTANVFALMGLRQLYFLIGTLLERLVYLSYGLAVLLTFIGVKLVLHAMHENELDFVNGGQHIDWAPVISIEVSLGVIVVTLLVTTVLSLWRSSTSQQPADALDAHTGPGLGGPHPEP